MRASGRQQHARVEVRRGEARAELLERLRGVAGEDALDDTDLVKGVPNPDASSKPGFGLLVMRAREPEGQVFGFSPSVERAPRRLGRGALSLVERNGARLAVRFRSSPSLVLAGLDDVGQALARRSAFLETKVREGFRIETHTDSHAMNSGGRPA